MAMGAHLNPPSEVTLVYRPVGKSHVFTANGHKMSGFHISSPVLKTAFELAGVALGKHVKTIYGIDAQYEIESSFDNFVKHLKESIQANEVKARITCGTEFTHA